MSKRVLFALLVASTASAKVVWEQKDVALAIHPTQVSAQAVFHFTNEGDAPVSFSNIQVTCGCLRVLPTRASYGPGEDGAVTVLFNLRNRQGPQHKQVGVETSDGQRVELNITADIPALYAIEPKMALWRRGDESVKKTIHLSNPNSTPIRLTSIDSTSDGLPAELRTLREGFEYEVVVERETAERKVRSVIRIATEPPPGMEESKGITLYAFVQ